MAKISEKIRKLRKVKKLSQEEEIVLSQEAQNYRALIDQIEEEYQLAY